MIPSSEFLLRCALEFIIGLGALISAITIFIRGLKSREVAVVLLSIVILSIGGYSYVIIVDFFRHVLEVSIDMYPLVFVAIIFQLIGGAFWAWLISIIFISRRRLWRVLSAVSVASTAALAFLEFTNKGSTFILTTDLTGVITYEYTIIGLIFALTIAFISIGGAIIFLIMGRTRTEEGFKAFFLGLGGLIYLLSFVILYTVGLYILNAITTLVGILLLVAAITRPKFLVKIYLK